MSAVSSGPARNAFAISPNDNSALAHVTRGIYVGGAGAIKVDTAGGDVAVTISGLLAGIVYPFVVTKIYSTGTTATNLVGLY